MISEQLSVNRVCRIVSVLMALMTLFLFSSCEKQEEMMKLQESVKDDVALSLYVNQQEIYLEDVLKLDLHIENSLKQSVDKVYFAKSLDDLSIQDVFRQEAVLKGVDRQLLIYQFKLYVNAFGEVKVPGFKVLMKDGKSYSIAGISVKVNEVDVSSESVNALRDQSSRLTLSWLPGVVALLTILYCLWVMVQFKDEELKVDEQSSLKDLLSSDLSEKDKAKKVFVELEKTAEFPEIKKALEKALFSKSDDELSQILRELEGKL